MKDENQTIFDLKSLRDDQLPRLWGEVMEEMLSRGVIHSRNNPISDIAETVVQDHLGGTLANPGTKAYDLKVGRKRIQVKGRRLGGRPSNLSVIRSEDFDELAVVVFDPSLVVVEILRLSKTNARTIWRRDNHQNGFILTLQKVRNHPNTRHVEVKPRWRR